MVGTGIASRPEISIITWISYGQSNKRKPNFGDEANKEIKIQFYHTCSIVDQVFSTRWHPPKPCTQVDQAGIRNIESIKLKTQPHEDTQFDLRFGQTT